MPINRATGWANLLRLLPVTLRNNEVPIQFALNQNYPNPFNPTTKIDYDLPKDANVKLSIYDILGKEIQILVNEYQIAGSYSFNFNASDLSSGTYIYRITANEFTDTKKFTFVK